MTPTPSATPSPPPCPLAGQQRLFPTLAPAPAGFDVSRPQAAPQPPVEVADTLDGQLDVYDELSGGRP